MKVNKSTLLTIILLLLLSSCATIYDAKQSKGTGQVQVYNASFEDIWSVMPDILNEVGLEKVEDNKKDHYILANRSVSFRSYGERVAIFIEPIDNLRTKVEVVSKKAAPLTLFTINWPYKIFEALGRRLKA